MAKIYKVEMYVMDINEVYDTLDEALNEAERGTGCNAFFKPFNVESRQIEWEDDIDINYCTATIDNFRKYFK